jgi:twitching motility protein PilJ
MRSALTYKTRLLLTIVGATLALAFGAAYTASAVSAAGLDASALNGVLWSIAIALTVGVIAVAGLPAWLLSEQGSSGNGDALTAVCDAVAAGDLRRRAVPSSPGAELGDAGQALNAMLDSISKLVEASKDERDRMQAAVKKLLQEVSGVAEGDLTVEAEVTPDVTGAVAHSFNMMIGELRQIIGQVQSTSRQVGTALSDLRSATEKLAMGSDDQAAQAVEASVAIEEMAASIHYVSENASSSATVAEEARTNAEHGTRAVTRTIEGMKAIRDQVQETSMRIKRLGESSQEIGEIVELIGDIADRTSILALNASIQAAMAGEAGRGFAVVAEEVERLADRATEATKRAGMLVKTTQSETAEVMAAMEDTTREVINRSNIANEAGVALSEIQGVSNRLAELIQAISDAAQQQAKGSEQVARSMAEMSSVTKNTAQSTKQTAASINSLGSLVDSLNAAAARFKLPDGEVEPVARPSGPRLAVAS